MVICQPACQTTVGWACELPVSDVEHDVDDQSVQHRQAADSPPGQRTGRESSATRLTPCSLESDQRQVSRLSALDTESQYWLQMTGRCTTNVHVINYSQR